MVRIEEVIETAIELPRSSGTHPTDRGLVFLFLYAVCEFFDHRVGQNLAGNALNLRFRGFRAQSIRQRKREILALAHRSDVSEPDLAEGIVDGLALGVKNR